MENPYAPPSARRDDHNLGVDDVQLLRDKPDPAPTDGAIAYAWERVKERPVQTILLAFLSTFFGGGRCSPPNLSGLGDLGDVGDTSSGGAGSGGSDFDLLHGLDLQVVSDFLSVPQLFGGPPILAQAADSGWFIGLFAIVALFLIAMSVGFFVLGVVLQAAEDIYWLRLLRGQNDDLGRSFSVGRYILPLVVAQLLVSLGVFAGALALIVPGVILWLGWSFVGLVVVDKELGYVDALKASWRITDGYKLDIFVMWILCILLIIVAAIPCGLGLIVALPVVQGAFVVAYVRIAEPGNSYLAPGEPIGHDTTRGVVSPQAGDDFAGSYDGPYSEPHPESSWPDADDVDDADDAGPETTNDDPYGAQW